MRAISAISASPSAKAAGRCERSRSSDHIDLRARVAALARRYELPYPLSVEWSDRQRSLWGSCTPALRSIRLSSRLAREPGWVLDYVIVHELAHLADASHGPEFWALVNRYPRTARDGHHESRNIDATK